MHKTGIEDYYVIKNNKRLRYGYTTGSCAAAAAKAAALMLLSGNPVSGVQLMTPKGILLDLEILDVSMQGEMPCFDSLKAPGAKGVPENPRLTENDRELAVRGVSCAVRKDGGDDPDATDGILVYALVVPGKTPGIRLDGGTGVGRVTRQGLQQAVGEAAINPVPHRMILREVEQAAADFEYTGGLDVVISIPQGTEIAKKTFNPRLGIEGGISVLGTSGIVVPMSEAALVASIKLEMEMLKNSGHEYLLITPGNYGEAFTKNEMTIDLSASMKCSNYVGETLDMAVNLGIKGILFVSHIGKFIKVGGGIMNTHSRDADCRAELLAAFALRAGADRETAMRLLDSATTDEGLEIMEEAGVRKRATELLLERIHYYLRHRCGDAIQTEVILFSGVFGYLGQTGGAEQMLTHFRTSRH